MNDEWGKWFRSSSDKYLVALIVAGLLMYELHVLHDGRDADHVRFIEGLINNLVGAFLTLVTGAILRGTTTTATTSDPRTGATTAAVMTKDETK